MIGGMTHSQSHAHQQQILNNPVPTHSQQQFLNQGPPPVDETQVQNLISMGFQREDCIAC